MGTKIQAKTYFSASYSTRDLNDSGGSGIWVLYHEPMTLKNGQYYNSFSAIPAFDGCFGYDKEQMRQTILKHESLFRYQLEELHRLYRRQRDLMNEIKRRELRQNHIPAEISHSSLFSSHIPYGNVKKTCHVSDFPIMHPTFGRPIQPGTNSIQSSLSFMEGKNIFGPFPSQDKVNSMECESPKSKCNIFEGRLLNLELPSAAYKKNEGKWREEITCERDVNLSLGSGLRSGCNGDTLRFDLCLRKVPDMVDLNEPIQVEEASISASVDKSDNVTCLDEEIQKQAVSVKSKSGFHYLSKESSQSSLEGMNGKFCLNNMHSDNEGKHTVLFTYKNQAGQVGCDTDSFCEGVCAEDSPALIKSLQVEHCKFDGPTSFLPSDYNNQERRRKQTIFGVEISEGNQDQSVEASHTPSQLPLIPPFDVAKTESSSLSLSAKASNIFSQDVLSVQGNPCTITSLPWLKEKEVAKVESIKGRKDSNQMNPHLLQNYAHLFADKSEMVKSPSQTLIRDSKSSVSACDAEAEKTEVGLCQSNSVILGCPIVVPQTSRCKFSCVASDGDGKDLVTKKGMGNCISGMRHQIDLNLCMNEDEAPPVPTLPIAILKIATAELDLEAPAALDTEVGSSPQLDSTVSSSKFPMDVAEDHDEEELVRVAAEAMISISLSNPTEDIARHPLPLLSSDSLRWFAEVVSSYKGDDLDEDSVPDGMDYFEFMTLNLTETKVEEYFSASQNEKKYEEMEVVVLSKRPRRGQARKRKDFQRDILPSLISLSKHEVTEDFQSFEELFKASGFAWRPRVSRRNGRGRRRFSDSSLSLTPTEICPSSAEQSICRERVLEGRTLTGWGKRTRRLPRQRCPTDSPTHARNGFGTVGLMHDTLLCSLGGPAPCPPI